MRETYYVGEYHDPQPEDMLKPFHDLSAAIEKASERSNCFEKVVVSIWDRENRVVYIFIDGNQFVPI